MLLLQMESLLVILIVLELKHFQMSLHQPMLNLPTKTLVHFMVQGKISKLKIKINSLSPFTGYFSYVACPDASRTPALSRTKEGLLVTEVDLNLIRQIRDFWTLRMTARLDMYADVLANVTSKDFKPKIVKQ